MYFIARLCKAYRVLSTVVGWCRIRIAVSLRMRVCNAYPCAFDGGWVVQDMHSGVITQDCVKLNHILSLVVGWCRTCIAVSLRMRVCKA